MLECYICHFHSSTPMSMSMNPDHTPTELNTCVDEGPAYPLVTDDLHGLRATSTRSQGTCLTMSTYDLSTRFRLPGIEGIPQTPQSLSRGTTTSTKQTINDYRVWNQRLLPIHSRFARLFTNSLAFPTIQPSNGSEDPTRRLPPWTPAPFVEVCSIV